MSQGSAATEFRCGGRFYVGLFRSLATNPKVKALLKSVNICQSYRKNKSGPFSGPRCNSLNVNPAVKLALSGRVIWPNNLDPLSRHIATGPQLPPPPPKMFFSPKS